MLPIRTILYATDFSEGSENAFRLACSLAGDYDAQLILVHVINRPGLLPASERMQQEFLEKLWRLPVPNGMAPPGRRLQEGHPAEEILRTAQIVHADLIVLGGRTRHRLQHLLGGHVAEKVMRQAECPVLTAGAVQ